MWTHSIPKAGAQSLPIIIHHHIEGRKVTTEKQIAANKQNAKASTGPKTGGGLKRSSKNAIKHSLTASDVTIFDEVANRFEALRDAYVEAWQPVGAIEARLVEQMAVATWRLNRAQRIETQVFENELIRQDDAPLNTLFMKTAIGLNDKTLGTVPEPSKPNIGSVFRQLSNRRDSVFPLLRYEIAAERSFYRALHNLERLQERRLGRPVSAPHVIDGDLQKDEA